MGNDSMAAKLAKGVVTALGDAADRLIPQGRDELANAIFNGGAYWPGAHPESLAPAAAAAESPATEIMPPEQPGVIDAKFETMGHEAYLDYAAQRTPMIEQDRGQDLGR